MVVGDAVYKTNYGILMEWVNTIQPGEGRCNIFGGVRVIVVGGIDTQSQPWYSSGMGEGDTTKINGNMTRKSYF